MSQPSTRLSAVSLFSGAGGLDAGLEQAGFRVATATDFDSDCCRTLEENRSQRLHIAGSHHRRYLSDTRVLESPIEMLSGRDLWSESEQLTLLAGGPPCQPFSSAGSQRGLDDPRGQLFAHFVRIAEELKPSFILFENVRGLVTQRGPKGVPGEALNLLRDSFESLGYATSFKLVRCADHGLPQRRVRLVMIGAKDHHLPEWPRQTHSDPRKMNGTSTLLPWVTLGDFMADQPHPSPDEIVRPSAKLAGQLADIPAGKGLKSPGRKEPTRPGGHWGYKQGTFVADPRLPARTVTAVSTQDWWRSTDTGIRRLTRSECAGLQGFPPDWRFTGSKTSQFRQIGNAVPVPIARIIGDAIAKSVVRGRASFEVRSADFPDEFRAAISYTTRDSQRNSSARVRLKRSA